MRILLLEPFAAGSHRAFVDTLTARVAADWTVVTMPGRHWKWRMRGCAAWFAERPELDADFDVVLASSYVPLAELIGIRPRLAGAARVLYFHENQLAYPVRDEHTGERDTHFGVTQMTAALAADVCAFNTAFNRDSFVAGARELLGRMPDARPRGWVDAIAARSEVWGYPLELPAGEVGPDGDDRAGGPLVLWNHRWEHDKGPAELFAALRALGDTPFRLAVCGEQFGRRPPEFDVARTELASRIVHWGHADRDRYLELLRSAHLALSTARHEFFGAAVLEAVHCGARPLVPDRLAYRETIPAEFRYAEGALAGELRRLCDQWIASRIELRQDRREITARFGAATVCAAIERRLRALQR